MMIFSNVRRRLLPGDTHIFAADSAPEVKHHVGALVFSEKVDGGINPRALLATVLRTAEEVEATLKAVQNEKPELLVCGTAVGANERSIYSMKVRMSLKT